MTLRETKRAIFTEIGLLQRHTWSKEYAELSYIDRQKIVEYLEQLDYDIQLLSGITRSTKKIESIIMYTTKGKVLRVFNSLEDGANWLGMTSASGIIRCCSLELKTYKGYIWRKSESGLAPLQFYSKGYLDRPIQRWKIDSYVFVEEEVFTSVKLAAKATYPDIASKTSHANIMKVITGKARKYKGFSWSVVQIK